MVKLSNQWGTFSVTPVEAARLRAVRDSEPMRRAVTLVLAALGGYVVSATAHSSGRSAEPTP